MRRSTRKKLVWAALGLVGVIGAVVAASAYFSPYQTCLRDSAEGGMMPLTAKQHCTTLHAGN